MFNDLITRYEQLALAAEQAFEQMRGEYPEEVKCERGCIDCCHALFGLFLIEAAYLREKFEQLGPDRKREVLARAGEAEEQLRRIQERLKAAYPDDPDMQAYAMARERVRCPFLNDRGECAGYPFRPITCRVYGIPVTVQGAGRACWKAAFAPGRPYPAFNLDRVYRELHELSRALLEKAGQQDLDRASLLLPVSTALKTPPQSLLRGEPPINENAPDPRGTEE
ncbi:MAG: YkgJ family cysteine cluster protein [Thermoanaerobacterales bacterium]|nr:YkgJ family cysteine cluster protein [Bacillota bacterium]MDI6907222.1 YkgJ family cysteine cluster protein [Thermoanaerobacterales bacterium]